jgi:hypothetical protein
MPKFKEGDLVMYQGRRAIIEDVLFYFPKPDGSEKKLIWYGVRFVGFNSIYAVLQKTNSLQKIKKERVLKDEQK